MNRRSLSFRDTERGGTRMLPAARLVAVPTGCGMHRLLSLGPAPPFSRRALVLERTKPMNAFLHHPCGFLPPKPGCPTGDLWSGSQRVFGGIYNMDTSTDRPVRLGLISAGYMGQLAHLENYARLPNARLVALAEGRPELARRVAARYGIEQVYTSHEALLAGAEVDAVVAILGFSLNYGVAKEILKAGKHLLTEKALCVTIDGGRELVELAERGRRVYQVAYMKRWDPGVRMAVDAVTMARESGNYGPLLYARIWCAHGDWTWHGPAPLATGEAPPDYGTAREPRPEGVSAEEFRWIDSWLNYYSHQTNLLRYALGEDYALIHYEHGPGRDIALVRGVSGVPACLEFPHYRVPGWDEGFEVIFERLVVRVDLPAPMARQAAARVQLRRADGPGCGTEAPYVPPVWAMEEQARGFVSAIGAQGPQLSPASEALKEVAFAYDLLQARRSAGG